MSGNAYTVEGQLNIRILFFCTVLNGF